LSVNRLFSIKGAGVLLCLGFFAMISCSREPARSNPAAVSFEFDEGGGTLRILVGDSEALVYRYGESLDLPHYWPLRSPGGKNMLVEMTEPYPHHRSFWFADTVRFEEEREVSTYNALYSGQKNEDGTYGPPFRDRVRHKAFTRLDSGPGRGVVDAALVWEMDGGRPILDEGRRLVICALGRGEYFLDLTFGLTASHGDVHFVSDDVHYAWPYLRLETRWSGENGGIIVSDSGATGQEATNMKPAKWLDYSNTVEGEPAGIAVFQWPDGLEHRWLTREYGCFGPRRPDDRSGKPFVLRKGETISQRVGILVHGGDVATGRVAQRYELYIQGRDVR
jgi:hypothetical protein